MLCVICNHVRLIAVVLVAVVALLSDACGETTKNGSFCFDLAGMLNLKSEEETRNSNEEGQLMISKFEEDAANNATEKAYCDDELAKTDAQKAELEDDVESLTSEIDRTAASSVMKVEVLELQEELAVNSDMMSKLEEDAANNAIFGKMGMGKMGMVSFFLRTCGNCSPTC